MRRCNIATGNWNTAGTWGTPSNTPTKHASTAISTGSTVYSVAFTAPNTTNAFVGCLLEMAINGVTTDAGTIVMTLQENSAGWVDVASVSYTGNGVLTDYRTENTPLFLKLATPFTYTAITAGYYRIKISRTGTWTYSMTLGADSGGSNFYYEAIDNRTGVPASTDDITIVGDGNSQMTVTVDGACACGSGSGTKTITPPARVLTNALDIGANGVLKYDRTQTSTLTVLGHIGIHARGSYDQGTIADPIPAAYNANLIQSEPVASLDFTGKVFTHATLFSAVGTGPTYWRTTKSSGIGTVADPLITADPVDWAVGTEIMLCANSDNTKNWAESQLFEIVTKNSSTSYVIKGKENTLNGDFELYSGSTFQSWTSVTTGGSIAADTGVYHGGATSIKLTYTTGQPYVNQINTVGEIMPGGNYTVSFWTKGDGTRQGQWQLQDQTNVTNIQAKTNTGVTGDWTQVSLQFTAPALCTQLRLYLYAPSSAGYCYYDDVSITLDSIGTEHSAGCEILNLTRNVIIKPDNYLRAGGIANNSIYADRVVYKNARVERISYASSAGACGFIIEGVAGTYATMDDCVFYGFLSYFYFLSSKNVETFSRNIFCNSASSSSNGVTSSSAANKTFNDCYWVKMYGSGIRTDNFNNLEVNDARFISCNAGFSTSNGAVSYGGSYNVVFNDCEISCCRLGITPTSPAAYTFNNCLIGTKGKNEQDNYVATDVPAGALFKSCSFDPNTLVGNYLNGGDGTEFIFHRYNDTDNYHFWITNKGKAEATGASLPDTTVRTSGSLALRIAPEEATTGFCHEFKILAKAGTAVGITGFIKKNATFGTDDIVVSLYLPGSLTPDATYTMPDDTTWDVFSLTASYTGSVDLYATVEICAKSVASGAYMYLDDLYNGTNKITALDVWDEGKPSEIIFEQLGDAAAVWGVAVSGNTTAGSFGDYVNKIKKWVGWLTNPFKRL